MSSPGWAKPGRAKRRPVLFFRNWANHPMPTKSIRIHNFIDGRFIAPAGGKYLDNIEPATGKPYSHVPDSDARDVGMAVAAAEKAFAVWSQTAAADRSRILLRIADLIERDLEKFARAESIDTGKPLSLARSSTFRARPAISASSPPRFSTPRTKRTSRTGSHSTTPCANRAESWDLISPWNLPLYLFSWKIAPALAGRKHRHRQAERADANDSVSPLRNLPEAGLPDGVLNIVHGTGPNVGAPITAHPKIGTISFTGGTVTGRKVAEAARADVQESFAGAGR